MHFTKTLRRTKATPKKMKKINYKKTGAGVGKGGIDKNHNILTGPTITKRLLNLLGLSVNENIYYYI